MAAVVLKVYSWPGRIFDCPAAPDRNVEELLVFGTPPFFFCFSFLLFFGILLLGFLFRRRLHRFLLLLLYFHLRITCFWLLQFIFVLLLFVICCCFLFMVKRHIGSLVYCKWIGCNDCLLLFFLIFLLYMYI